MTAKLLEFDVKNSLLVIVVASVVELVIIQDLLTINLMTRLKYRSLTWLNLILSLLFLILSAVKVESLLISLGTYAVISMMISLMALYLQEDILKDEVDVKFGFLNMQFLRNLAKMFGFIMGIVLNFVTIAHFYLYILVAISLINLLLRGNYGDVERHVVSERKPVREKYLYLLQGILSTVVMLWIPLITKSFIANHLETISWLPFVLPGIFSMILIQLQKIKPILFDSLLMEIIYTPLLLCFYLLRLNDLFPMVQALLFSLLSALTISIGIKLRKRFIVVNRENNMKYVLQTLSVNSAFFSLFFSLLGSYQQELELALMLLAILTISYMMIKRREFR